MGVVSPLKAVSPLERSEIKSRTKAGCFCLAEVSRQQTTPQSKERNTQETRKTRRPRRRDDEMTTTTS